MPTVITTPAAINANSYISIADAATYFGSRLYGTDFTSASQDTQERAVIWATALLDRGMDWFGAIRTLTQRLRWPRSGVVDRDGRNLDYDTIPEVISSATAELALALIQRDRTQEPELFGLGFDEASVGSLRVKINSKMVLDLVPQSIRQALEAVGAPYSSSLSGDRIIKLVRS